jgi:hypothetical protein
VKLLSIYRRDLYRYVSLYTIFMFKKIQENLRYAKFLEYTKDIVDRMYMGEEQTPPDNAITERGFRPLFLAHCSFLNTFFIERKIDLKRHRVFIEQFGKEISKEQVEQSFVIPASLFYKQQSFDKRTLEDLAKIVGVNVKTFQGISDNINQAKYPALKMTTELVKLLMPDMKHTSPTDVFLTLRYTDFLLEASRK